MGLKFEWSLYKNFDKFVTVLHSEFSSVTCPFAASWGVISARTQWPLNNHSSMHSWWKAQWSYYYIHVMKVGIMTTLGFQSRCHVLMSAWAVRGNVTEPDVTCQRQGQCTRTLCNIVSTAVRADLPQIVPRWKHNIFVDIDNRLW